MGTPERFLDLVEKRPGFGGARLVSVIHGHAAARWVIERGRLYFPTKHHLPELAHHTFTEDEAKRAVESMLRYALYNGFSDDGRQIQGLIDWLRAPLDAPDTVPFNGIDRSVDSRLVGWSRRAELDGDFTQAMADVTRDILAQYPCAPPTHWLVNPEQALDKSVVDELREVHEEPRFHLQVIREPECPLRRGFVVNARSWRLHHLGDQLISFGDMPPRVAAFYGNLVCSAPWLNGTAWIS